MVIQKLWRGWKDCKFSNVQMSENMANAATLLLMPIAAGYYGSTGTSCPVRCSNFARCQVNERETPQKRQPFLW